MTIHARTSAWTKTVYDPYVNMLRNTTEAFSGAMGGVDSLHVCPFDEPIRPAEEFSRRVSRNVQIILQEEAHLVHPIDAPGGSWYIEKLTDAVARKAWGHIQELEGLGGMAKAIETGLPKMRIEEAAARRQARIDAQKEIIVGVNRYRPDREDPIDILEVDNSAVREAQLKRLEKLRAERDETKARACLNGITRAAESGEGNLLALALEAARARCSLGEISLAMEKVYGRHKAVIRSISGVYSTEFGEEHEVVTVRKMADAFEAREGRRPRIMIAKMGQDGHDRGAKVVSTAFADLGFDVDVGQLFQTPEEAAAQAVDPSSTLTRGSILGDKTRMEGLSRRLTAFIRPSPSGGMLGGVARKSRETMLVCEAAGYDVILVETVGVGQSEVTVRSMVDFFLLVLIAGAGDELQGIKKGIMELCDTILVNKADGDNRMRAQAARMEYVRILHYLQPATEGWTTQALACSSHTGAGIPEVWEVIQDFVVRTRASGVFERRRTAQAMEWVHSMVQDYLRTSFFNHPDVRQVLPEIERGVVSGRFSPTVAADLLVKCFKSGNHQ